MMSAGNPEVDYLIAQRARVIAKLSQIAVTITAAKSSARIQLEDEKTYTDERGGDLDLFKLKKTDEVTLPSTAELQHDEKKKSDLLSVKNAGEDRRQNRKRRVETDYTVVLDADVFSANRKGKPIDKAVVGIGGAAEQVTIL